MWRGDSIEIQEAIQALERPDVFWMRQEWATYYRNYYGWLVYLIMQRTPELQYWKTH